MSIQIEREQARGNIGTAGFNEEASLTSSFDIPLSFAQERLWFLDQLHPGNSLYNVPSAVRIHGDLDLIALERSLRSIVERHEILRTTYGLSNATPVQEVHDTFQFKLDVADLSSTPPADRDKVLQRRMKELAALPFDLKKDLMLRSTVFKMDAREHVLFLNIHHIACDEWSMGVFFKELGQIYASAVCGRRHGLSEPPVQYADFALWQRESMDRGLLQKQLTYWKGQLAGELPVLELPTDYARPPQPTFEGAKIKRVLSKELSAVVASRCRTEQVTPFIFFVAAFKALLYRYTGQEDLIIGTPIAGRNRMETENLIGFFVNTLALRTKVAGELSFRDYLAKVREATLSAFANQDIPFEKVVEEVQPDRSAAQNPIFNVMFAVQNRGGAIEIPGLQVGLEEVETDTAKFDLTLVVQDTPEGFVTLLEFNSALFSAQTASRLVTHYESIIGAILANPSETLARLQILSPSEQEKLLVEWNQTSTNFPNETVHSLFATQAARRANDIAVVFGTETATYREIDQRSNQLAHYLRAQGVGPDVLVGICMERSVEMIVGWLGILKAGGAYVPLDPGYPPERLQFMLEDSRMPLLLTQKKLASRLPENAPKLCLDSEWSRVARESSASPDVAMTPENLAYVIYTSGSTGKPKGAAVPHRAIARLVFNTNYIHLGPNDVVAQASNSSFDAATFEVWGALLLGGKLVGVPQNVLLSPADMVAHLRENRISTLFLTTALFNQVAAEIPNAFSTLKHVLFGGEACDPRSVKQVLRHGPPQRLLHVYGPTETTTFASWYEIENVADGATTIPIGRPLSNTTFYVLDKNRQPVPIGVPGELYIGGDCLARGYHNREELTASKFVSHPFISGQRLYRTGDLVRYQRDGNVEFLGRIDNQVKIRGFRIELEEIEIALEQHSAIRDATVIVRDEPSGKRLVAYVVAQNPAPALEDIRTHLRQKVPDFMVPAAFVFLDALPLTPNGKIDRRALPEPASEKDRATRESDLPRNNLENQLAKIWESVLRVKPIGIHDNFFELGGHSLLAVRLFSQIEKTMGQKLPLSTLFQAPTIEGLAGIMRGKSWSSPGASLVEIQPRGTRPPMFWLHTLGGGGGGGLFVYRKLAELLGPDQPSYGLVTPPEPFASIELMAAHYIGEIKTVQPVGPYHVGGYCFGGIIAFEIARQLVTNGDKVGLLALIDSAPPGRSRENQLNLNIVVHCVRTFPEWLALQMQDGPRQMFTRGFRRIGAGLKKCLKYLQSTRPGEENPSARMERVRDQINQIIDFTHYPEHYKRYAEVHWTALDAYRPGVFEGPINLYRTARPHLFEYNSEHYWARLSTQGVQVKVVPGTHEKVLESPHVEILAHEIRQTLGILPAALCSEENIAKIPVGQAA